MGFNKEAYRKEQLEAYEAMKADPNYAWEKDGDAPYWYLRFKNASDAYISHSRSREEMRPIIMRIEDDVELIKKNLGIEGPRSWKDTLDTCPKEILDEYLALKNREDAK